MLAERFVSDPAAAVDPLPVLRLARSRRVGAASFHRLLAEHGSAGAAFAALPEVARAAGVSDYTPCPEGVAEAELRAGRRLGARLLVWGAPDYPPALRDLPDAPPVLWVRGDMTLLERPAVAVVGARNASALGLRMARGMAGGLAQAGVVVIAGLARGIDTAAHEAALEGGTIAVLAGGLDRIYPSENLDLAARIAARGLLVSEQAPGVEPAARLFPLRNRIVSGLARGVVVVEAAHRSGTLITAGCAADQGREVMAVPGHPLDARAAGCNVLLRDGAALVRGSRDVLAVLGLADAGLAAHPVADPRSGAERVGDTLARPGPAALAEAGAGRFGPLRALAGRVIPRRQDGGGPVTAAAAPRDAGGPVGLERRLLALLGPSPVPEEELLRHLGIATATLLPVLTRLELDGRIQRSAGGRWQLA